MEGKLNYEHAVQLKSNHNSAVQTPVFSPPAPAPAPAKETSAPGKKLRLRQKILGLCKFVKVGNFYSLNWKRLLCFLFNTSHSSH